MNYLPVPFALVLVLVASSGCSVLEDGAQRGHDRTAGFDIPATYTTADVRIITQRVHPVLHNPIMCTEPAPDVAKALATALQGGASGGNGTVNGNVNFGAGSSEGVAELAGRSTALLGLRDGLYKTCEAFANGALGADAYALVLSRYGQLMTTLFLGQDISAAAGAEARASVQSPPITLSAPPATGTGSGATKTNASAPAASPPPAAQNLVGPAPVMQARVLLTGATQPAPAAADKPAVATPPAATPPAGTPPVATSATPPATTAAATDASKAGAAATTAAAPAAGTALALTRMNEDYLSLDYDLTHTLLVLCVNESDPTRLLARETVLDASGRPLLTAAGVPAERAVVNTWLMGLCGKVTDPAQIGKAQADSVALLRQLPNVDPTGATRTASANPVATASTPARPAVAVDPTVRSAQQLLLATHVPAYNPGAADGILGSQTKAALRAFQQANQLPITETPDAKTLDELNKRAGP